MEGIMGKETVELVIGAVFVIIHTYSHFNSPPSNRGSTTALRYHTAALTYCFIYLVFYYSFTKYPGLLHPLAIDQVGGSADMLKAVKDLPPALVAALVFTVLLNRIPLLSGADAWLRNRLQRYAEIPNEARRLAKQMLKAGFDMPAADREQIKENLLSAGFKEADILFDESGDARYLWTRISVLMAKLESWGEDRKYSGYICENAGAYQALENRYERLARSAKTCFQFSREALPGEGDVAANLAVAECQRNFVEQARALSMSQCDFISQGVLSCQFTESARCRALAALGFDIRPNPQQQGLVANQLAALLLLLMLALMLNIALFGTRVGGAERTLIMITMIATIYVVSVACAVCLKGRWAFTLRGADGTRPVLSYLLAGLAAVAVAIPVSIGFRIMIGLSADGMQELAPVAAAVVHRFATMSYPWMLTAFVTAAAVSFLLDNRPVYGLTWRRMRWLEGAVLATANVIAAYVVMLWLNDIGGHAPPIEEMLPRAALIGFLIGFIIPAWYRNAPAARDAAVFSSAEYVVNGLRA
jgi:hypothetical protein